MKTPNGTARKKAETAARERILEARGRVDRCRTALDRSMRFPANVALSLRVEREAERDLFLLLDDLLAERDREIERLRRLRKAGKHE